MHHHNHDHHNNEINKRGSSTKKLLLVILFNVIITVAEYIGGVLSGSLALISDAGHNFSDVLSLILGLVGERVSAQRPNSRFSFGMKRFEVLVASINSFSLVLIGGYIVYEAVVRYLNPVQINPRIMLPVAVIGLAGNVFSIFFLNKERNSNLNLRAAFLHLLYDAISSIAVISVGIILLFSDIKFLDLAVSFIIAFMIVWSSMDIIRESLRIFLQGTPKGINPDEVYESILGLTDVASVHGLHIWSISSTENFLSCHICINGNQDNVNTDGIINRVNNILEQKFKITHTTIQIENTNLCKLQNGNCCR